MSNPTPETITVSVINVHSDYRNYEILESGIVIPTNEIIFINAVTFPLDGTIPLGPGQNRVKLIENHTVTVTNPQIQHYLDAGNEIAYIQIESPDSISELVNLGETDDFVLDIPDYTSNVRSFYSKSVVENAVNDIGIEGEEIGPHARISFKDAVSLYAVDERYVNNKIQFLMDELTRLYALNDELAHENQALYNERTSLQEAIRRLNDAWQACQNG